jgi:glycosyltransferase involved in cell wall biosynthesis/tetratricopeptide (TPR) repeat protein
MFNRSGFGDEARGFVLALDRLGVDVHANGIGGMRFWETPIASGDAERIERLVAVDEPEPFVHVIHAGPDTFRRHPRALLNVGRGMFETAGLPLHWIDLCNRMDEVWVPSDFNIETFAGAGVVRDKLFKIHEGLDPALYDPPPPSLRLDDARGFVFLSVFGWGRRKGWDVLVRAFLEEFGPDEDVTLALKIIPSFGLSVAHHRVELETYLRSELTRDPLVGPPIVVIEADPGPEGMPGLYAAADAFVLPSHGEGWGRPYMEAMASGLPTIGTRWSGNLEFMSDENAYLVDCVVVDVPEIATREWPLFAGQRWAQPSVPHLKEQMRRVFVERGEARRKGARARAEILSGFTWSHAAQQVVERLRDAGVAPARARKQRRAPRRPVVVWEGPQFVHHSMALVNRELCRALIGTGRVELALRCADRPGADPALAGLAARVGAPAIAEVHVRHEWPPSFRPPDAGRWVLYQPWELGPIPADWVEPINRLVDEVWTPSTHAKDCFVASGIDPDKVVVVPQGVNPLRFNRGAQPLPLPTRKLFRFLFVGGTIRRKGADIALRAYVETFGRDDDVCLVVKDFGADSFYAEQGLREQIRALQSDPVAPEIVYLDEDLPDGAMPSLYAACDCLVAPYRAEGFGLPVAEAMACGLPVIVTDGGACSDFCDETVAYLVPAREVEQREARVGHLTTVAPPRYLEVDVHVLGQTMRRVTESREEARVVGRRASERILRRFTWREAADAALERIERLATSPPPRRRLSVCVIARDEEHTLPRCLDSVRRVADELIVVDTGSSDGTVQVAASRGATVGAFAWDGDFAAARNESLRRAGGDWVLVLDADQYLDRAGCREVQRLIAGPWACYVLRQRNYTADGFVEHLALRLFPNHPNLRYTGRVHEQLVSSDDSVVLPIVPCDIVLHHDGYRSRERTRAKSERDAAELEQMAAAEPANAFHRYNLGVAYRVLAREEDAERELRAAIRLSPLDASFLPWTYLELGRSLLAQRRPAEAEEAARGALGRVPGLADAHALRARALRALSRPEDALAAYQRALACPDAPAWGPVNPACAGWKSLAGMAELYEELGRPAEARACLERVRKERPRDPEVARALALATEQVLRPST